MLGALGLGGAVPGAHGLGLGWSTHTKMKLNNNYSKFVAVLVVLLSLNIMGVGGSLHTVALARGSKNNVKLLSFSCNLNWGLFHVTEFICHQIHHAPGHHHPVAVRTPHAKAD